MSVHRDTAQALVFLLASLCCDTAQATAEVDWFLILNDRPAVEVLPARTTVAQITSEGLASISVFEEDLDEMKRNDPERKK